MCYDKLSVCILGCSIKRIGWMSEMMYEERADIIIIPVAKNKEKLCKVQGL